MAASDSHPVSGDVPVTEEDVIRLIQSLAGASSDELAVGIGDDAAVLRLGGAAFCVTTDLMVEGVHFNLAYISPYDLGRRAIAANLSDLAAMGARPRWGFLSLGLPGRPNRDFVEGLVRGVMDLGREHGLDLAGGDTVSAPQLVINLCLVGAAEAQEPVLRSGAREGDAICVTGRLGAAAAGLAWLAQGGSPNDPEAASVVEAHLRPQPRVAAGRILAQSGRVSAMIDVSDGLATDLARLCAASQTGALVKQDRLPLDEPTRDMAQRLEADALDWALTGGEDFELLFTCAKGDVPILKTLLAEEDSELPISRIGIISTGRGVLLERSDGRQEEITHQGYDHFREEQPE